MKSLTRNLCYDPAKESLQAEDVLEDREAGENPGFHEGKSGDTI